MPDVKLITTPVGPKDFGRLSSFSRSALERSHSIYMRKSSEAKAAGNMNERYDLLAKAGKIEEHLAHRKDSISLDDCLAAADELFQRADARQPEKSISEDPEGWAKRVARGRSNDEIRKLAAGRLESSKECFRRSEFFRQRGEKLSERTWMANGKVDERAATALRNLIKG